MTCRNLIPTVNPDSSIPELIKFIRHSFRECEYDEVQNVLMNREKSRKVEMENLVREHDSLKKEHDSLENIQSLTALDKCSLEEKLKRMQRRGEELDKMIVQKGEKIEKLESEKLDHEEKLVHSSRKCKEMNERLVKMGNEIEELRRENLCANKTIEELKAKEIEADRVVQELKRENCEAAQTIDELRAKKMETDKAAEVYKSGANDLNRRISMLESALAQMLSVNVEDLATLVNGMDNLAAAATDNEVDNSSENGQLNTDAEDRIVVSPEVPAVSDVDVAHSGTEEDDANRVCTNPGSDPASSNSAVAESNATVQVKEGEELVVRGSHTSVLQSDGEVAREKTTVPSSSAAAAGNVVIEISDSDSDDENMASKKGDRRESGEDSAINCSRKRRRSNSTRPSGFSSSNVEERQKCGTDTVDLVESEDESYSDTYINDFIANLK